MNLKQVFKKTFPGQETAEGEENPRPEVPAGIMKKCNHCQAAVLDEEVRENHYICPKCGRYFRMPAYVRIRSVADPDTFEEWDREMPGKNPLNLARYEKKLDLLREKTGLDEAVVTGKARILGHETVLCVMDSRFLMASMGSAVGEKIARAAERAAQQRLPVVIFACSGGARMQEGIVSLMQMAKTSAALKKHSGEGLFYAAVLTDPVTGGVTASFAMQGDIILSEPGALVGFAGPRVIEQTIGQKLPAGFQTAEYLLEHGFIDGIVPRETMRGTLGALLALHEEGCPGGAAAGDGGSSPMSPDPPFSERESRRRPVCPRNPWERVQAARDRERPSGRDYISRLFPDFTELHGDRCFGDDRALIGGIASFLGRPVTVIAQVRGNTPKEQKQCRFGMAMPEGYRKALRLMRQAEKFHRPVLCFVDTPGAFCGIEAEQRGQGEAIAEILYEMIDLEVPILAILVGEGGSGGALALAAANEVWMLENAVYSILSPEGFASILWKDSKRAGEAAQLMGLTAPELLKAGIVERVFSEPERLTRDNFGTVCEALQSGIGDFLSRYASLPGRELAEMRYRRFRRM